MSHFAKSSTMPKKLTNGTDRVGNTERETGVGGSTDAAEAKQAEAPRCAGGGRE